jgi:hypothetical protein
VGIWELESIEMSGAAVSSADFEMLFPTGMPHLWFNEDNTVDLFNFFVEHDADGGDTIGVIENGTYAQSGNTVSITYSGELNMQLTLNGDVLIWQTDNMVMRFQKLPDYID